MTLSDLFIYPKYSVCLTLNLQSIKIKNSFQIYHLFLTLNLSLVLPFNLYSTWQRTGICERIWVISGGLETPAVFAKAATSSLYCASPILETKTVASLDFSLSVSEDKQQFETHHRPVVEYLLLAHWAGEYEIH